LDLAATEEFAGSIGNPVNEGLGRFRHHITGKIRKGTSAHQMGKGIMYALPPVVPTAELSRWLSNSQRLRRTSGYLGPTSHETLEPNGAPFGGVV